MLILDCTTVLIGVGGGGGISSVLISYCTSSSFRWVGGVLVLICKRTPALIRLWRGGIMIRFGR